MNSKNNAYYTPLLFLIISSGLFASAPSNFLVSKEMPVIFRENAGQWNDEIIYSGTSVGWNANVYFMKDKLSFGFARPVDDGNNETIDKVLNQHTASTPFEKMEYMVWNMNFKNCSENVTVGAMGMENSRTNYLMGEDFSKHRTNVRDYRLVEYKNIYDKIDVRYYGTSSTLKYDFVVNQGGKISNIQLQCEGVLGLAINKIGELEIETHWGKLIEKMPESYQIVNGRKNLVNVTYRLIDKNTFGFKVEGEYDVNAELIIDPVTMAWCTFVGGIGATANGYLYDIAVDAAGNTYGTGYYGSDFPTTPGVYDPTFGGVNSDAYVFKLDATGTNLIYCTYLGGAQSDWGWAITVDATGAAYVKGVTRGNFPVTAGAYDVTYNGGLSDMFICKLNAAGTTLVYSTYVGGTNQELDVNSYENDGIVVNAAGEVFTAGRTWSNDFPTTPGCFDNTYNGGFSDGIVLRLNATGSALIYSTYFGGNGGGNECALGLPVNAANEVYITGYTTGSTNLPVTAGAYQAAIAGSSDAFVAKFNAAGSNLIYCTYLGGTNYDVGSEIAINAAGEAYITGSTGSANFPTTAGAYDVTLGGSSDFFVTKLNATGTGLVFSTYVGGSGGEGGYGIALNSQDEPFVAGGGVSVDFPTTNCAYDMTDNGSAEIMFFKLDAAGSRLDYGTYIGGNHKDYTNTTVIVRGPCGKEEAWVSCTSHSINFPTTAGVFQQVKQNSSNDQPVVFKFNPPTVVPGFTYTPDVQCNMPVAFTDTANYGCGLWTPVDEWFWEFGDGATSTTQNPTHTYTSGGTKTVKLILGCYGDSTVHQIDIVGGETDGPSIVEDANCEQVLLSVAVTANATYLWNTGETTSFIVPQQSGEYWVQIDMGGGCAANDTIDVTQTLGSSTVFFPNTFTPNNDNLNEDFFAKGTGISEYKLQIFDRWGNRIFETNNFNQHWDGIYMGNPAQQDVYVWKAKFKIDCLGDQLIERVGHVSLLR